jgi:hypothetical protein
MFFSRRLHPHHCIISLTSISGRLNALHRTIESLLLQNAPPHTAEVRLYLSETPFLLDSGCSRALTPELRDLELTYGSRFRVLFTENIGPHRKILPVLSETAEMPPTQRLRTLIVTADDDTLYPRNWLASLVNAYQQCQCVVGYRGRAVRIKRQPDELLPYRSWHTRITENPSLCNVATGKDGILYNPLHLHPSVLNKTFAMKYASKADDLWLKVHTLLTGARTFIIKKDLHQDFDFSAGEEPKESLWLSYNKEGGNDECIRLLDCYLSEVHRTSLRKLLAKTAAHRHSLRKQFTLSFS